MNILGTLVRSPAPNTFKKLFKLTGVNIKAGDFQGQGRGFSYE